MTRLIVLALSALTFATAAFPQSKPRITQQATATFPSLGMVRIRALETPQEPLKLEFYSLRQKTVLTTLEMENSMLSEKPGPASEFLRFQVTSLPSLSQPLIFAVMVSPGGSDATFFAYVIGWKEGRFQVLSDDSIETQVQGGLFLGNLGKEYGYGVASWTFLWCAEKETTEPDCRETHYDKHRYEINLYPLDTQSLTFKPAITLRTKRKYAGHGEGALKEFGFTFQDVRRRMNKVRQYADY